MKKMDKCCNCFYLKTQTNLNQNIYHYHNFYYRLIPNIFNIRNATSDIIAIYKNHNYTINLKNC